MSQPIIKIENLSKLYRLGEVGTGTLSHDLNRWWATKVLRREDPNSKIGTVNDRTQAAKKGEHVWALRDINLELQEGDVLGIIGKNGAGKSTLLKLLSQVTSPTTGRIRARGRMASLLEVGTGFHPEMTGRENIYMNGTIMGMRKTEITDKLDEIVEFSGVAKYLDTPVKRYSSGMSVRLGFAIAAHLEPEILVVDEVLAVGDAEFQKKAIGKMQDVSKSHGRTVLFVSHNMAAVKSLCKNGMVLINGSQCFEGKITDAIDFYQDSNALATSENNHWEFGDNAENNNIRVNSIKISPQYGTTLDISSGVQIEIDFFNKIKDITEDLTFEILTKDDVLVFHHGFVFAKDRNSKLGEHKITAVIPPHLLNANIYSMNLIFGQSQRYVLFRQDRICAFEVENIPMENNMTVLPGVVRPAINYSLECHDSSATSSSLRVEDRRTEPPDTGEETMTGGRFKRVTDYVKDEESFCLTYGDGVSDVNIAKLISFHKPQKVKAKVTATIPLGRFGALDLKGCKVNGFMEKPKGDGAMINGGFFVLSPKVIEYITDDQTIWEHDPLERLAQEGDLAAFQYHGLWQPMDTLRDKTYLEELWKK